MGHYFVVRVLPSLGAEGFYRASTNNSLQYFLCIFYLEGKSGMSAFDDNDAQKSMTAAQYLKRDPEYTSMIDCAFAEMRLRRRYILSQNYRLYYV